MVLKKKNKLPGGGYDPHIPPRKYATVTEVFETHNRK